MLMGRCIQRSESSTGGVGEFDHVVDPIAIEVDRLGAKVFFHSIEAAPRSEAQLIAEHGGAR